MDKVERITKAIKDGEVLRVIYHGGTQPGAMRELAPMYIRNGLVMATCYTSDAVKTFTIDKIEIIDNTISGTWWKLGKSLEKGHEKTLDKYTSIAQVLSDKQVLLTSMGWTIQTDSKSITLHRKRKNGSVLKGCDVSINYEEFTSDSEMDETGKFHDVNKHERKRPWIVRAKNYKTETYANLDNAAEHFIAFVKLLAPNTLN